MQSTASLPIKVLLRYITCKRTSKMKIVNSFISTFYTTDQMLISTQEYAFMTREKLSLLRLPNQMIYQEWLEAIPSLQVQLNPSSLDLYSISIFLKSRLSIASTNSPSDRKRDQNICTIYA